MTPTPYGATSGSTPAELPTHASTGPFMLTLCRLASPDSVRPPREPQLQRFKFFTSSVRDSDGSQRLYLHMGYFTTLTEARNWAQVMRGRYPDVIATLVPAALLRRPDAGIPTLAAAASPQTAPAATAQSPAQLADKSLTDTQVLNILEARRASPGQDGASEQDCAHINLLRPDDTATRRSLKDAVIQRAPVSFAVQLQSSTRPIDLTSVPSNSIFRAYTLYAAEDRVDGGPVYCLRLGFFNDAISAKQVACFVRSGFPAVAVVPVLEDERNRAKQSRIDPKILSDPFQQHIDQLLSSDAASQHSAPPGAAAAPPAAAVQKPTPPSTPTSRLPTQSKAANDRSPGVPRSRTDTLEQTLELLSDSELWTDDSASETGVRHLKVEIQKRTPRPS